jgi:hypothetical protein
MFAFIFGAIFKIVIKSKKIDLNSYLIPIHRKLWRTLFKIAIK